MGRRYHALPIRILSGRRVCDHDAEIVDLNAGVAVPLVILGDRRWRGFSRCACCKSCRVHALGDPCTYLSGHHTRAPALFQRNRPGSDDPHRYIQSASSQGDARLDASPGWRASQKVSLRKAADDCAEAVLLASGNGEPRARRGHALHPGGVQDLQHHRSAVFGDCHQRHHQGRRARRVRCGGHLLRRQVHLQCIQGVPVHGLPQSEASRVHRNRAVHLQAPAQPFAGLASAQEDGQHAARDGPRGGVGQLGGELPLSLPPAHHGGVPHRGVCVPPALQVGPAGPAGLLQPRAVRARHHQAHPVAQKVPRVHQQVGQRVPRPRHRQPHQLRDGQVFQRRSLRDKAVLQRGEHLPEVQHIHTVQSEPIEHRAAAATARVHVHCNDHHDLHHQRRGCFCGGASLPSTTLRASQLPGYHLRRDCERLGGHAKSERAARRATRFDRFAWGPRACVLQRKPARSGVPRRELPLPNAGPHVGPEQRLLHRGSGEDDGGGGRDGLR
mmetsp:Transcript_27457/g.51921  ORF Transcript_27457/g.51921 Transcript_27457/m.51921 type:complete len:499 (+) Transcript_27457:237-1733(+)